MAMGSYSRRCRYRRIAYMLTKDDGLMVSFDKGVSRLNVN